MANDHQLLDQIKNNPEGFFAIHYSCQSLNDENDGLSPRVTSIAIIHLGTLQPVSFSTHAIAEELKIEKSQLASEFDKVERKLLKEFGEFVLTRKDKCWIHWNMRNITYGFEHIEHRYRKLLKSDPPIILVENRINLNDLFERHYGADYAPHPRLPSLMELNGGKHRHVLTGAEEVAAFNSSQFIKMHQSTLAKVHFLATAAKLASTGKLKTKSHWVLHWIDQLMDSRPARVIAFFSGFLGIPAAILQFLSSR